MLEDVPPRRVVPRWRSSWVTATTPEAKSNRIGTSIDFEPTLRAAEGEFRVKSSVPLAAELMYVASSANNAELAKQAAQVILENERQITSTSLVNSAKRIVNAHTQEEVDASSSDFIRGARTLLIQDYNNPILLIDVAHAMTANSRAASAERFIRSALQLAPTNRFVLRSAVRYFLHVGKHDHAHLLLLKSPLLSRDPWIQASEIAVASVLGKTSKLVKSLDRSLQDTSVLASNYSELGSAIATVHLNAGAEKKAKKLFTRSLANPNDNSVAQAEWASQRLSLVVTEHALGVPLSFEANSGHSYRALNISDAISQGVRWMADEPFASRPAGWLGYLHSIDDDFQKAAEFHQMVLKLEGENSVADLLNLNFSRIETGALEVAAEQLMVLSRAKDIAEHSTHLLANAGALSYANGDFESGRELYQRAISYAKAKSETNTEGLVRAFFARAAVKYGDPHRDAVVKEGLEFHALSANPGATYVMQRLVDQTKRKQLEASAKQRIAKQKLAWNPATNTLTIS